MKKENEASCVLRVGKVQEFDAEKHMSRVKFPDIDIVSHWLPVIAMNSLNVQDTHYLDKDEHVVCIMNGTGTESGYVLGAIYDAKNEPEDKNCDIRQVKFSDDTVISYDREEHRLMIDVKGDIDMTASGNIKLTAGRIDLN